MFNEFKVFTEIKTIEIEIDGKTKKLLVVYGLNGHKCAHDTTILMNDYYNDQEYMLHAITASLDMIFRSIFPPKRDKIKDYEFLLEEVVKEEKQEIQSNILIMKEKILEMELKLEMADKKDE